MIFIHPIAVATALCLCLLVKLEYVDENLIILAFVVLIFDTLLTMSSVEELRRISSSRVLARVLNAAASLSVAALGVYILWHFMVLPLSVLGIHDSREIAVVCFYTYLVIKALTAGVTLLRAPDAGKNV